MTSEKNIEITHANHSATSKAVLTKMLVQPERLYFLFAFCELSMVMVVTEKHQNNCFYTLFLVLKLATLLLFEEMLVLTSY